MAENEAPEPLLDVHNIMCAIEDAAQRESWNPHALILALIQEAVKVAQDNNMMRDATVHARLAFAVGGAGGEGVAAITKEYERLERDGLVTRG